MKMHFHALATQGRSGFEQMRINVNLIHMCFIKLRKVVINFCLSIFFQ